MAAALRLVPSLEFPMFSSFILLILCGLISSDNLVNGEGRIKINSPFKNVPSSSAGALIARSNPREKFLPIGTALDAGSYLVNVTVGKGHYTLIVDSGSAYTWVGANTSNPYIPGPNSIATGQNVSVPYGSGNFTGFEFIDTIVIGDNDIIIHNQQFGSAVTSFGFEGVDGILGIGPQDRTFNTTGDNPLTLIPTVSDQMLKQNIISKNVTSVSLSPLTTADFVVDGEVVFGGIDTSKFIGNLTFVPPTEIPPASTFWGFEQSLSFGESRIPLLPAGTPGIMDTGTTLILLAPESFEKYQQLTGAVLDDVTGLLRVDSFDSLQSLFFNIGGTEFEFIPDAQVFPPQLNVLFGGDPDAFYIIIGNLGDFAFTQTGPGMFVNGYFWLMRHFVTYNGTDRTVGVAQTENTFKKISN